MMRANLLPRPKEMVSVFGLELDSEYLRQGLLGLAIVLAIAVIGIGIETLRLHRIEGTAIDQEAVLASRAAERSDAKRLALDVARYQEIAREEDSVRRSGAVAAVSIARIGNAVPARVWLDSLTHDTGGFELIGGSRSVDALGGAMLELGAALAGHKAVLVNIDNRNGSGDGVHFTARIASGAAAGSAQ
jgi:hypothetical protein